MHVTFAATTSRAKRERQVAMSYAQMPLCQHAKAAENVWRAMVCARREGEHARRRRLCSPGR